MVSGGYASLTWIHPQIIAEMELLHIRLPQQINQCKYNNNKLKDKTKKQKETQTLETLCRAQ